MCKIKIFLTVKFIKITWKVEQIPIIDSDSKAILMECSPSSIVNLLKAHVSAVFSWFFFCACSLLERVVVTSHLLENDHCCYKLYYMMSFLQLHHNMHSFYYYNLVCLIIIYVFKFRAVFAIAVVSLLHISPLSSFNSFFKEYY